MAITPYLKLQKPPFDDIPWDEALNTNMDKIDAFAAQFLDIPNYVGAWQNATAYVSGQNVSDVTTAAVYQTHVTHTSSALPTTFAQERVLHPTYWELVSTAAPPSTLSGNIGRNLIHNPLFNIAQRGTGAFTTQGYTLDRWFLGFGFDTVSVAQSHITDATRSAIGDETAENVLVNTFTGNANANSYNAVWQLIENVRRLSGKTVTISFWAATTSGTPKLGISIDQSFGTGGSPSTAVNGNGVAVTLNTTWTRYSVTIVIPSTIGKTLGTNNDSATELNFWFSSGTILATRAGNIGIQSSTIALWGVQLEIGSVATPLEKPDPRYDLSNCHRFFITEGMARSFAFNSWAVSAYFTSVISFPVQMRATPSVQINPVSPVNVSSSSAASISTLSYSFMVVSTAAGGTTVTLNNWNASADL